jgi:hypothetical protein
LLEEARRHVNRDHPDSELGNDQIQAMVGSGAYEKEEVPSGEELYSDDPEDESAGTF